MRRDDYRALVEQRRELFADLNEVQRRNKNRALSADEQHDWDAKVREIEHLNTEIEIGRAELAEQQSGGSTPAPAAFRSDSRLDGEIETAIRSINKGESRALSTAVSVSPGELSTTLFDRLRASSVVLKTGIRTLTTEADSVTYPALTADAAPAWTSEAAPITPSDPTFGTVVATPRKLSALVQVSNEALTDSDPKLTQVLNDHLLKVLALKADAGLLEGTGTPPEPVGLKNVAGKQTLAAATNGQAPTFDNFADAIALLEAVNVPRERMRIVAHPRNLSTLRKAKASTAGSYLWQDVGNAEPATVFGVPIVASPQLAVNEVQGTSGATTNSAYVYDVDSLVYVQRTPIEIEVDRSRLFNSDQSEFRAKLRADLISPTPTGIVRVTGLLA